MTLRSNVGGGSAGAEATGAGLRGLSGLGRLAATSGFMAAGDWDGARLAIFGVPMDETTSYRPGTRFGPARIREASYGLEEYSLALGGSLVDVPFCDLGDLELPLGDVPRSLDLVREVAGAIAAEKRVPVVLGGEHLLTLGIIRALADHDKDLAVVQFDAHADLRADYLGVPLSHACVMRRAAECLAPSAIHQFGIRSATVEEAAYGRSATHFHATAEGELAAAVEKALASLAGRPLHVTIDIDVLDPAEAPGTGTPEPGGASFRELVRALGLLRGQRIVGVDLVEVAPDLDPTGRTPVVAAKILREVLISWFSRG